MNQQHEAQRPGTRARVLARNELLPGLTRAQGLFFLAAGLSFLMSVYLFFSGDHERGIFVGLWVPSILAGGALLLGRDGHE